MRADKLGTVAAARREGEREKRVSYEFCLFWKIGLAHDVSATRKTRRVAEDSRVAEDGNHHHRMEGQRLM